MSSTDTSSGSSAAASSAQPTTVPLHPIFVEGTGWKIGITIGFEASPQGWKLFEFDTGGPGFWAGYSSDWWPTFQPIPPEEQLQIKYASGNEYTGIPGRTPLYFTGAPGTVAMTATATVARIVHGKVKGVNWQNDINNNRPPLYSNFYGDFGADLNSYPPGPGPGHHVISVLLQVANGFIVEIGPYPSSPTQPPTGQLQIGLTEEEISGMATVLPLSTGEKGLSATGVLRIGGRAINLPAGGGGSSDPQPCAVLFDSGAPSTHIWTGTVIPQSALAGLAGVTVDGNGKGTLPSGLKLELVYDGITIMSFTTGTQTGKNLVTFSPAHTDASSSGPNAGGGDPPGYVNTGLVPFFGNRITFYPNGGNGFIALAQPGGS
jgi:hypothetical protein